MIKQKNNFKHTQKIKVMKKSVLLKSVMAFAVLFFVTKLIMAEVHDPNAVNELKQILNEQIKYPKDAQENLMSGFAVVALTVNEDGKIKVEDISASSPYFKEYVESKLQELVLNDAYKYEGETIYFRFDFKLIDNY